MKMVKQKKSGISLIVLVITIIVMIILAAAIILSLDGSDIIERAKGAQSSNDVATAKEIVSLAKSEWAFEKKEGYDSFREYAESKLEEAGFDMDNTYVEDSGRVLFDTAARFAKAGVEIGTEVQGYTLNSTTSYTTSGKENTWDFGSYAETDLQPQRITRDSAIKWTYIGADEDGNALIGGSVSETTPQIALGGKGGYLNGPAELDAACEALYSSSQGTARSMNIDDLIRVLEYTGEKGSYIGIKGYSDYMPTSKVKTIDEISKEIGYNMNSFGSNVPETGKNIGSYKSNYFYLNKINDAIEYNATMADIIFLEGQGQTTFYWLSSSCVQAYFFNSGFASFNIWYVSPEELYSFVMSSTSNSGDQGVMGIRPVVILSSDVQVSYNGTTATLK